MSLESVNPLSDTLPPMPNPTPEDLLDPRFNKIWDTIKTWDVNVPEHYVGYCGATGSHAKLIHDQLKTQVVPYSVNDTVYVKRSLDTVKRGRVAGFIVTYEVTKSEVFEGVMIKVEFQSGGLGISDVETFPLSRVYRSVVDAMSE